MNKPSFWPKNPYPESIFPMPRERYPEIVPDSELRTALSGMLGRELWDIASEAIWAAMLEAEDEWTEIWPTEPGHYWFYGRSSMLRRHNDPGMVLVEVSMTPYSCAFVGNGRFIGYEGNMFGLWKKAALPEPPSLPREPVAALVQGGGDGLGG